MSGLFQRMSKSGANKLLYTTKKMAVEVRVFFDDCQSMRTTYEVRIDNGQRDLFWRVQKFAYLESGSGFCFKVNFPNILTDDTDAEKNQSTDSPNGADDACPT